MISELFVFDCPPVAAGEGQTLKITAKRYTTSTVPETDGLTLLFAHCIGTHKEIWEPTIERIFSLHRIREAWSFDWQSHGDAAVLNRLVLNAESRCRNNTAGVSVFEWAKAIAAFVKSPRMEGHRIVAIGHSAGAGAVMLSTSEFDPGHLPYIALILVEPTIVKQETYMAELEDRTAQMDFVVTATATRREAWESREAASAWLGKRFPWNMWDPRVVKVYTEHGLHPSLSGPKPSFVLKCDRKLESLSYADTSAHFAAALQFGRIAQDLPVHVIWGTRCDIVPRFIQDDLTDASQGRVAASVIRVPDAGHMVVQESPDALAEAICEAMAFKSGSETSSPTKARL